MPDTATTTRSRIFHELDFDKPGKQIGYLRVPQSRDGGAWSTIEIPIAVINGGKGPAVLFTGGVPGDARGSFCQVLAHFIDSVILPQVEVCVDVHAAGNSMEAALSTTMHWVNDPKVMERTRVLAENFAAPYNVIFWGVDEGGTMVAAAERHGVLSISSELGGYGRVSVEGVRVAERGL